MTNITREMREQQAASRAAEAAAQTEDTRPSVSQCTDLYCYQTPHPVHGTPWPIGIDW